MDHHKRNLPHYYPSEAVLFVTWRLFGSLPLGMMAAATTHPDAGHYVERNPVVAGLAQAIDDWPWSSASAGRKACSTM